MKKAYETPKVEKMAFNYSDVVVASSPDCYWEGDGKYQDTGCYSVDPHGHYVGDKT